MWDISLSDYKKVWSIGGGFVSRNWILNLLIRLNTIVLIVHATQGICGSGVWTHGIALASRSTHSHHTTTLSRQRTIVNAVFISPPTWASPLTRGTWAGLLMDRWWKGKEQRGDPGSGRLRRCVMKRATTKSSLVSFPFTLPPHWPHY